MSAKHSFFAELKRHDVCKVVIAYAVASSGLIALLIRRCCRTPRDFSDDEHVEMAQIS